MRWLLTAVLGTVTAGEALARQEVVRIVDQVNVDDAIVVQGCVRRAENPNSHILTGVTQWPIIRPQFGPYGLRHYWTNDGIELSSFIGDTVQIEGKVSSIRKSEIELEPGLAKYGKHVEFERPGGNVLVNPALAGVDPSQRKSREDIPLTLIEVRVDKVFRVMAGCLPHSKGQTTR